jgi:plastocyanin
VAERIFIRGLVREQLTGLGVNGVTVRAHVKGRKQDDVLGEARTGCDGRFQIAIERDLRDLVDRRPNIHLHVMVEERGKQREIYATRYSVPWSAGHLQYTVVELPEEVAAKLPCLACEDEDSGSSHEHHDPGHGRGYSHGSERSHGDGDDEHEHCDHPHHHTPPCKPITRCRDIYLRIEPLPAYTPVAPDDAEHDFYRMDCMLGEGHEGDRIPEVEVNRRRLDALVYREYLDANYTIPKNDPIVPADIMEPRAERRIPGTVIYTSPGERLFVHVCNADVEPRSFHVHGLIYGIDSDGSWPFGVADAHDCRSDAICPGQRWTYVLDVCEETIGAWPFHDHHMHIAEATDRGLFGGLVVRDPSCPVPDYEVPFFYHHLVPKRVDAAFDSGPLSPGATFSHAFPDEGTFDYQCRFHPMSGVVRVLAAGPATAAVNILDGPGRFDSNDVTISVGGTVTWTHAGAEPHTVTESGGSALDSYAINGRSFVGNTPIIVARSGCRIRWYVFNLDLSATWHNFHTHGQRWQVGHEIMDTRSLGPAESFVVDTIVPPVLLMPLESCRDHAHRLDDDCGCSDSVGHKHVRLPLPVGAASNIVVHHGGGHGGTRATHAAHAGHGAPLEPGGPRKPNEKGGKPDPHHRDPGEDPKHPSNGSDEGGHRRCVRVQGDFLVHCHVEMHMMMGMAAVVRATQDMVLTPELEAALGFVVPLATGEICREVPSHPCAHGGVGSWEQLSDLPIFVVHAALLRTGKVLLWSGTAEMSYPLESRVWNPADGTMTTQLYGEDLFCSGHAFLPDGRLCIAGGAPGGTLRSTHIFDAATETWTKVSNMSQARWYPTVLTLPDGRILAASGTGANQVEIYDAGADAWTLVSGATRSFPELYPALHLLPSGQILYSRAGWAVAAGVQTAYLTLTGAASGAWTDFGQQQFYERQEGTVVIQIDTTVSPPATRIFAIGGGVSGTATTRNPQTAEMIDVTYLGGAAWARVADLNFPRTNVNAVLLPDGRILVIGGQRNGKWNTNPGPVLETEIYDPVTNTWTIGAAMAHARQYHSIAVLLPDGRVMTAGGVDPSPGAAQRDQRYMEIYSPPYLSMGARPTIAASPANAAYGASFAIGTPDAARIDSVALLRPGSTTHHTDAGARYVRILIQGRTTAQLTVRAPADGNIAPPGFYLLFIVDSDGVPSEGHFIRIP